MRSRRFALAPIRVYAPDPRLETFTAKLDQADRPQLLENRSTNLRRLASIYARLEDWFLISNPCMELLSLMLRKESTTDFSRKKILGEEDLEEVRISIDKVMSHEWFKQKIIYKLEYAKIKQSDLH